MTLLIRWIARRKYWGKSVFSLALLLVLMLSGTVPNDERGMMNDELKTPSSSFVIQPTGE